MYSLIDCFFVLCWQFLVGLTFGRCINIVTTCFQTYFLYTPINNFSMRVTVSIGIGIDSVWGVVGSVDCCWIWFNLIVGINWCKFGLRLCWMGWVCIRIICIDGCSCTIVILVTG